MRKDFTQGKIMKKKSIVSFVLFLLLGAAVFFIGWVEFFVPAGKCGVMISKTGGVYGKVIRSGTFDWRWERLLPTNTHIHIYSTDALKNTHTITGSLPSSDIYSNLLEGKPDFSYRFSVSVALNIKSEALPAYVKGHGAVSQDELNAYILGETEGIARSAVRFVLDKALNDPSFVIEASLSDTELLKGIDAENRFPDFTVSSLHINELRVPDTGLYNAAKSAYNVYQVKLKERLEKSASAQAAQAASDYLELERFSRLGRILSEYPLLIDFLSVSKGKNVTLELPKNPKVSADSSSGGTDQ